MKFFRGIKVDDFFFIKKPKLRILYKLKLI